MPRKPRKRGEKAKKRGISKEQVCVACALDRTGNIITELICKGRMTHMDLERLYKNRIGKDSIFCTDSHKSYIQFANYLGLEHQRIKRGKFKEGIYHIQHVNSFHSKLKEWMIGFHGVATKYLANYMYWFKWLQYFNNDKDIVKGNNFLIHSNSTYSRINIKDYKVRQPIYS